MLYFHRMKFLSLLLLILILQISSISSAEVQNRVPDKPDDLQIYTAEDSVQSGRIWVTHSSGQPLNGRLYRFYPNGKVLLQSTFKKGLLDGPQKIFNSEGGYSLELGASDGLVEYVNLRDPNVKKIQETLKAFLKNNLSFTPEILVASDEERPKLLHQMAMLLSFPLPETQMESEVKEGLLYNLREHVQPIDHQTIDLIFCAYFFQK